jgi:VWFA-related protein
MFCERLSPQVSRSRPALASVGVLLALAFLFSGTAQAQLPPSGNAGFCSPTVQANAQQQSKPDGKSSAPYSMRVTVPLVTLDVTVLTENGFFVPDLKKENFRVFEDGVPQTVTGFSEKHSPITAVLLVEYTADTSLQQINALRASYRFTKTLRKDDWAALLLFDKELHIAVDFTQDSSALQEVLSRAYFPLSHEINLFDALNETLDRLQQVEGRKYVILMASGIDTFSKGDLDDVLKRLETVKDTMIFSIDTGKGLRHLQEDNQMGVFARMTGGRIFFPVAPEEYGDAFHLIGQTIRNRYVLSYRPSNTARNTAWRKIKVTVVNPAQSQPGSKDDIGRKYQVVAREGYRVRPQ